MKKGDIIRVCYADQKPIGPYYVVTTTDQKAVYCNQIIMGTVDTEKAFYLLKSRVVVIPHTGTNVPHEDLEFLKNTNGSVFEGSNSKRWQEILALKQKNPSLILNIHTQRECFYVKFITAIHTTDSTGKNGITLFGVEPAC